VDSFTVKNTPWIEFGPGTLAKLGDLVGLWSGQRVFVVIDQAIAPLVEPAIGRALGERLAAVRLYDAPGEPTVAFVDGLAEAARRLAADAVIGVGGGSAMDSAKAVSVLLTNPGSAADYQGPPGRVVHPAMPLILVPTTAGSGSEATWSAVLVNEATGVKRGINGPLVFAKAAILDPELTVGLPARQTAVSGMDALIHAVESYTCRNATPVSQMYSLKAMECIFRALPRALEAPGDIEVRGNLLLGAHLAGVAIINSEVGLSHALSYPLSVRYRIPHGLGNAILFPHTSAFNAESCPAIYDTIGSIAGHGGGHRGIGDFLARYVRKLDLAHRLSEFGVEREHLDGLVSEAYGLTGPIQNHRRPIVPADLRALYEAAL